MSNAKISDIITAIPALAENGSNWSIFKLRFRLALSPHGLYHFFVPDPDHTKPVNPISRTIAEPRGTLTETEQKLKEKYDDDLAKWDKNNDTARYILSRVLPDTMLRKIYSDDRSVKEMWDMLCTEYQQKTSLVQADLRAKFQSYRCPEKGDIRVHLNRL
jgi:hypothetical protein